MLSARQKEPALEAESGSVTELLELLVGLDKGQELQLEVAQLELEDSAAVWPFELVPGLEQAHKGGFEFGVVLEPGPELKLGFVELLEKSESVLVETAPWWEPLTALLSDQGSVLGFARAFAEQNHLESVAAFLLEAEQLMGLV